MTVYPMYTSTDIQNCYTTYPTDPVALMNCIRQVMGYPPVTPGNPPPIDNTTITCLRAIFEKYRGTVDTTTGHMRLPYQTVINMINEMRACLGLPPISIPNTLTCMIGCMPTMMTTRTDVTECMRQCMSGL